MLFSFHSSFYIRSIRVGIVELFLKYFDSSQFLFILMAPDVVRSTLFASSLWLTRSCRRVWNSFSPVCTTKTIFSVPQDPSQCCSFLSEFEHKKYQFFSITSISIASNENSFDWLRTVVLLMMQINTVERLRLIILVAKWKLE